MAVGAPALYLVTKALLEADDMFSGDIGFAEPCNLQGVIGCWIYSSES